MVYKHQSQKWHVGIKGMKLSKKDIIKTLSDSYVDLIFEGIAIVRLKENTSLELMEIKKEISKPVTSKISLIEKRTSGGSENNILKLLSGKLLLWVKHILQSSTFEVLTPIGVAGVRGTRFMVSVPNDDTTIVSVLEGIVEVKNIRLPDKKVLVKNMQTSIINKGLYPSEPRKISKDEHGDLNETLELKLLKKRIGFKRKPGGRYNGIYSSNNIYWEDSMHSSDSSDSSGMGDKETMSVGSKDLMTNTMGESSMPGGSKDLMTNTMGESSIIMQDKNIPTKSGGRKMK